MCTHPTSIPDVHLVPVRTRPLCNIGRVLFAMDEIIASTDAVQLANSMDKVLPGTPQHEALETPQCRFCLEEGSAEEFIIPCKCEGTSRFVHESCLRRWQSEALSYEHALICQAISCWVSTYAFVSLGSKRHRIGGLTAKAQRYGGEGHKACKACEAQGAWPNGTLWLLRCGGFADAVWQKSGLPAGTWHQGQTQLLPRDDNQCRNFPVFCAEFLLKPYGQMHASSSDLEANYQGCFSQVQADQIRTLSRNSTKAMVRRHWLAFVPLGLVCHRLAFTGFRWQPAIRPVFRRAGEGPYPELCVFDLDACLWDKEMYEMEAIPEDSDVVLGDLRGRGEGVTGVMSGAEKISLHKGAMKALQNHADGKYPGMKIAVASSADTPFAEKVGRKALSLLEVLPGVTVWQLLLRDWEGKDVNQIGRQPPLSSNKARTHFPRLKEATGVSYDRMLFFDDCLWGDHCGMVAQACRETNGKGVVTVRTPSGLGEREWDRGLTMYASAVLALTAAERSAAQAVLPGAAAWMMTAQEAFAAEVRRRQYLPSMEDPEPAPDPGPDVSPEQVVATIGMIPNVLVFFAVAATIREWIASGGG
eukprot:s4461_g1.t1